MEIQLSTEFKTCVSKKKVGSPLLSLVVGVSSLVHWKVEGEVSWCFKTKAATYVF